MNAIEIILSICAAQFLLSCLNNMINRTRIPEGYFEFFKFTFLPYVLFNLKKIKKHGRY